MPLMVVGIPISKCASNFVRLKRARRRIEAEAKIIRIRME